MANNPQETNNIDTALLVNNPSSDQSTLLQMLIQQNQLLAQMVTQGQPKKTVTQSDNDARQPKQRKLHFTNKEIRMMPTLKDFTIRFRNKKYYEFRFRRYGYNVSFTSKSFDEAKQKAFTWMATFEEEIKARKSFVVLSGVQSVQMKKTTRTLFGPFADDYMENVKKKMVKENSYKSLYNTYKNHIRAVYGNYALSSITPQLLQPHFDKLHDEIPRVCEDVKSLMNGIMDYAVNNQLIAVNPIKSVYVEKHQRTTGKALTKEEERAFIEAIKGDYFEYAFLRMLYCGVRPCEVNEVVENNDGTLTIKNGKLKRYQKNLYRTIPMFPLYQQNVAGKTTHNVDVKKLSVAFTRFCSNHQLKDLRHTFTTRARECKIENELVAIWTGHSLGNITASVYTHFSMEYQQKEAEKLLYEI